MIKSIILLTLACIFQGRLIAQEVVIASYNSTLKKIDKKIDVINNMPNSLLLGYTPAGSSNDRKQVKPSADINTWLQQVTKRAPAADGSARTA